MQTQPHTHTGQHKKKPNNQPQPPQKTPEGEVNVPGGGRGGGRGRGGGGGLEGWERHCGGGAQEEMANIQKSKKPNNGKDEEQEKEEEYRPGRGQPRHAGCWGWKRKRHLEKIFLINGPKAGEGTEKTTRQRLR